MLWRRTKAGLHLDARRSGRRSRAYVGQRARKV